MKEWELKLKHHRDFVDSLCESRGDKKPDHPDGAVQLVHFRTFYGGKFWASFGSKGHSSCDYVRCKCKSGDMV